MLDARVLGELEGIVGASHVLTAPDELLCYSYDATWLRGLPDAVVLPVDAAEVDAIVRLCDRERVALIPRGSATNLAGSTIPFNGGLVLNLTRMNRILELDPANLIAVVQPGVVTGALRAEAEKLGLFYPPDPSSFTQSTVGGNLATNAGGPRCLKYGVTAHYVLGLEVVTPRGGRMRSGGRVVKNVTGYPLHQIFLGSEGTLGVIVEATLRLIPKPRQTETAMAVFPLLDDASAAVSAIIAAGLIPSALEFMDQTTLRCLEPFLQAGLPVDSEAVLLIEADGSDAESVRRDLSQMAEVCAAHRASEVKVARTRAEADQLWSGRRAVSTTLARMRPNKLGEDISVPRSAIPAMVRRVAEIAAELNLTIPVFGHAGDGNLHPNILFDRRNPEEWQHVTRAAELIFEAAVSLGGTLSGEHGIGLLKRDHIGLALDPALLQAMAWVKAAFDPNGIMNPGKKFPTPSDLSGAERPIWG